MLAKLARKGLAMPEAKAEGRMSAPSSWLPAVAACFQRCGAGRTTRGFCRRISPAAGE
jgi:hypothetical protein